MSRFRHDHIILRDDGDGLVDGITLVVRDLDGEGIITQEFWIWGIVPLTGNGIDLGGPVCRISGDREIRTVR